MPEPLPSTSQSSNVISTVSKTFDSLLAMLANEPLERLETLIVRSEIERFLANEYPPREEQDLIPDTQQAFDRANERAERHWAAEAKWQRLPTNLQEKLWSQLNDAGFDIEKAELWLLE